MLFSCESLILFHYFRRWSDSLYFNYVNESFRALCIHHFGRQIRNSFNWSSCGRRFKFVLITSALAIDWKDDLLITSARSLVPPLFVNFFEEF
ncbi:MAG: hypothetical protein ACTS44_00680 [Candidatus Hodgkinia cicadicola]